MNLHFDEIGLWTETKLSIIEEYARAYSKLLKKYRLKYIYIDGFAGAGEHISKNTGVIKKGSPLVVLNINPKFNEYHFVDIDTDKIDGLKSIIGQESTVYFHTGDCNIILPANIFPIIRYEEYYRAFCLLDPYGLHLDWNVIQSAGKMRTIDILLNFPTMDINRNVLRKYPEEISEENIVRMNRFWGDNSWKEIVYRKSDNLLGWPMKVFNATEIITNEFQNRIKNIASFRYVSKGLPMRNSKRNVVYYLLFASHNETAVKIMDDIFKKYRN